MRNNENDKEKKVIPLSELEHFSASGLKLFMDCPHSWANKYIYGNKSQAESKWTKAGKEIHAFIEEFNKTGRYVVELLSEIVESERNNTVKYVETFCEKRRPYVFAVEMPFTYYFRPDAPPIYGFMDCVSYEPHPLGLPVYVINITDYKSNRSRHSIDVWRKKLQQRVYAWVARKIWPEYAKNGVWFTIGYTNYVDELQWETNPDEDQEIEAIFNEVWQMLLDYAGGDLHSVPTLDKFPQNAGESCHYCTLKKFCKTYQTTYEDFDIGIYQTEDFNLQEKYIKLKEVEKAIQSFLQEIKEEIQEKILAEGPLVYGDKQVVLSYGTERQVDYESMWTQLTNMLDSNQITLNEVKNALKFNLSGIDKLTKSFPSLESNISVKNKEEPTIYIKKLS